MLFDQNSRIHVLFLYLPLFLWDCMGCERQIGWHLIRYIKKSLKSYNVKVDIRVVELTCNTEIFFYFIFPHTWEFFQSLMLILCKINAQEVHIDMMLCLQVKQKEKNGHTHSRQTTRHLSIVFLILRRKKQKKT